MKTLPTNPRFLICRLSAVGDTVHTLPLANLIKERWPTAFIAWAAEKGPATLLQDHPAVDQTVVIPKGFLKSPARLVQIARQLRALKIDVALDPQSLTKSATLAWLSGAKRRIGFTKPIGREIAPWLNSHLVAPRETHVVRRYLELLRPLGVQATERDVRFDLHSRLSLRESVRGGRESLAEKGLIATEDLPPPKTPDPFCSNDYAIINPGAGWDSKVWPAERYGAVARQLSIPSLVVWAGDKERAWAEEIVAASQGRAQLAPATSLLELTALIRSARLFVGSDTGPLHIAAAVGTPCVAMYGPTRPAVCGPYGEGHRVLQARHESLGSSRKSAGLASKAMLEITAEQVHAACEQLLSAPFERKMAA